MVEVRRKDKESIGMFARRFTRKVQRSGILINARKLQYRKRPKSKTRKKHEALKRELWKKEFEKRKKMGKVEGFRV